MPGKRRQIRPGVERLDARVVLSTLAPAVSAQASADLSLPQAAFRITGKYPIANKDRAFTPADLQAYSHAYLTFVGRPEFMPQYDFNGNGFIGQNDATPILRGLRSITPRKPLELTLSLAPGQAVKGSHPANNGPVTRLGTVTIIGKTTPNSIVFIDGKTDAKYPLSTGNFKFQGGAVAADEQGNFSLTYDLTPNSRGGSLTAPGFLVRTPYGQQLIRSYPIRRLP